MPKPRKAGDEKSISTNFRFSPTCRELLRRLAAAEGLNDTAYLEMTLRRLATEKNISADQKNSDQEGIV